MALVAVASIGGCEAKADGQAPAMLDPLREQALHPDQLIARLHLAPDAVAADLGAGPGFFTLPLARAVPAGRVIATDVNPDYLAVAARRVREARLPNVETRVVPRDHPGLGPSTVDLALAVQLDHYLDDRARWFGELARALRPGGRLALVNYARHREPALAAARAAGFVVVDEWAPSPPFYAAILTVGEKK